MQKRLSSTATMVGVNGDMFHWETGRPSGVLMRDGVVESPPYGDRSSVGVTAEGSLDIRRVEYFGTWRGLGQRRTVNDMNEPPGVNGVSLFTPSYGPVDAVPPRHRRRRDRAVPAGDAQHRPVRPRRGAHERRPDRDPARRRGARRPRHGGAAAAGGGAARHRARAARHPPPRLDRHHAGNRRRPGARAERQAGVPLERGVHAPRSWCRAIHARRWDSSRTAASSSSRPTAASRATASA